MKMVKRPFSEISEDLSPDDAVNLILEFSEDIINSLNTLKASTQSTPGRHDVTRFSALSAKLLPAFQSLAKRNVITSTTEEKAEENTVRRFPRLVSCRSCSF
jgi:hypothetical protein